MAFFKKQLQIITENKTKVVIPSKSIVFTEVNESKSEFIFYLQSGNIVKIYFNTEFSRVKKGWILSVDTPSKQFGSSDEGLIKFINNKNVKVKELIRFINSL